MSYELIGIVILGISQVTGFAYLARLTHPVDRSFQEQLRRNLALETKFQKWETEKLDGVVQRFDEILEMLRKGQL